MDHGQLSMVADKFQWVFAEPLLNACSTEAKFCHRPRIITPFLFMRLSTGFDALFLMRLKHQRNNGWYSRTSRLKGHTGNPRLLARPASTPMLVIKGACTW